MTSKAVCCVLLFTSLACASRALEKDRRHEMTSRTEGYVLLQRKFHTYKSAEKADFRVSVPMSKPIQDQQALDASVLEAASLTFWIFALVSYSTSAIFVLIVWVCFMKPDERVSRSSASGKGYVAEWRVATKEERLRMASVALLIISCTMIHRSIVRFWPRPDCAKLQLHAHVLEVVGVSLIITLTIWCWFSRSYHVYWCSLSLFLFYIPASALPPFSLSCNELQKCRGSQTLRYKNAAHHNDCSLQGQTAQLIFLSLLLLSPWLMPEERAMYIMWVWIFAVYVLWSVAYLRYSEDGESSFDTVDIMVRFTLLSFTMLVASLKKHFLQRSQKDRHASDVKLQEDSNKSYSILKYVLPQHVIKPMLMAPGITIAEAISMVSIMFIVIDDFETVVAQKTTKEVMRFLRDHYTAFDNICTNNGVTKLETVAEEYVCGVGLIPDEESGSHSNCLARLFNVATEILHLQTGAVKFRMGINTGPVVAGVIGQKLPRFRVFGDTMNTAARMMQKGAAGRVQFGEATYEHLTPALQSATHKVEDMVEMKGKGKVQTFLFGLESSYDSPSSKTQKGNVDVALRWASFVLRLNGSRGLDYATSLALQKGVGDFVSFLDVLLGNDQTRDTREFVDAKEADALERGSSQLLRSTIKHRRPKRKREAIDQAKKLRADAGVWILNDTGGFTDEMEKTWQRSFHEEQICSKLKERLAAVFLTVAVVTIMEVLWNMPSPRYPDSGWHLEHDRFSMLARLQIFVGCRILILAILALLAYVVWAYEWVSTHAVVFQWCLTGSVCVISLALLLSYDVMIVGVNAGASHGPKSPFDQIFALVFVLMFFCIIRILKVRFHQTLVFVPLALLIAAHAHCHVNAPGHSGVYIPVIGQVLFVFGAISGAVLTLIEEQSLRAAYVAEHATTMTNDRVNSILNTMMPPLVLKEVRSLRSSLSSALPQHSYELATVAQSDLCGFTKLASTRSPKQVVQFITEIFGCFDRLADKHGVYKVETVGDAYIGAQAEHPLTLKNSPSSVIQFGIEMVFEVVAWSQRIGEEVRCRVGVHHGCCVGGIVDMHMQAYHLFGDLMQGLDVLESTAPEGGVQISQSCRAAVLKESEEMHEQEFDFKVVKGDHLVTSKGEIHSFEKVGGRTFVIEGPGLHTDS